MEKNIIKLKLKRKKEERDKGEGRATLMARVIELT